LEVSIFPTVTIILRLGESHLKLKLKLYGFVLYILDFLEFINMYFNPKYRMSNIQTVPYDKYFLNKINIRGESVEYKDICRIQRMSRGSLSCYSFIAYIVSKKLEILLMSFFLNISRVI